MGHIIAWIVVGICFVGWLVFSYLLAYNLMHPPCPYCGKRFKQKISSSESVYSLKILCLNCNCVFSVFDIWKNRFNRL